MSILSAFADEIAPDLKTQMAVCARHGVRCIDVRSIDNTNVSKFTLDQARRYRREMDAAGLKVACIGSPIGKIRIDEPFAPHLDLLKHCFEVGNVLGTRNIRIFSFYGPEGGDIANHRAEVMDRMAAMVKAAEQSGMVLLHENEKAIYGSIPRRVSDIFATIKSKALLGIFDPSNYVEEGVAPYDDGWTKGLADVTHYFHIKDKVPGAHTCVPAGEGVGQIEPTLADAKRRGYDGVLSLEPHMSSAGQYAGFTGPELFAKAVAGLKAMCDKVGIKYQ